MKNFKRFLALLVVFSMVAGLAIHQFGNSFRANESAAPVATEATEGSDDPAGSEVTEATEAKSVKTDEAIVSEAQNETAAPTGESAPAGKQDTDEASEPEKAEYTISIKEPEKDGGSVFASSEGSMKKVAFSGGLYSEKVAEGEAFELQIKTKSGYQIDKVEKQDGSVLSPVSAENGTYSYKIDNVAADIKLSIAYEEIKTADSDQEVTKDSSENKKENDKAEPAKDNKDNDDKDVDKSEKPAQTIKATAGNAVITVKAPAGALPAGATVKAVKVNSFVVENSLKDAVDEEGLKLTDYQAYDITIYDKEGRKIQPDDSVKVTVSGVDVKGSETAVYHISSDGVEKVAGAAAGNTVYFDAEQFSIYAVSAVEGNGEYPKTGDLKVWYRLNDRSMDHINKADGVTVEAKFLDEKTVEFKLADHSKQWSERLETENKKLKSWDVDNEIYGLNDICIAKIEGNEASDKTPYVTVYPVYEYEITLSFDANGADGNVPAAITEKQGSKVTLPGQEGMTNAGKTFMGWGLKKETGHTTGYDNNANYTIYPAGYEWTLSETNDTTLYAVWAGEERAKFFIRLDGKIPYEPYKGAQAEYTDHIEAMRGKVEIDTFYAKSKGNGVANHIKELPSIDAIRNACNDKANSIHFSDGSQYTKCDTDKEFNDNYYILWYVVKTETNSNGEGKWIHVDGVLLQKDQYNVTYDPGCLAYSGQLPTGTSYAEGVEVTVESKGTLARAGYTFGGWIYENKTYEPGYKFTMPGENVNFVARWIPNGHTPYKVEYYLKNIDNDKFTLKKTANKDGVTGTTVTAEELAFDGYRLDKEIPETLVSGEITGDGALTLKLYYVPDESQQVEVKYESESPVKGVVTNSDSSNKIQKVTGEGEITGSTATAKRGYKFTGWYVDSKLVSETPDLTVETVKANLNKTANGAYEIYQDTTFTAKFAVDESQTVQVIYRPDPESMGSVTNTGNTIEVITANNLTGSTATAGTGYEFIGWYVGNNKISDKNELTADNAKKHLNKANDGTYEATTFIAKFKKDEDQTQDTKYTVHYTIEGVEQINAKIEVTGTAWVNDSPAKIAIAEEGIPTPVAKYKGYKLDTNNPTYPKPGTKVDSGTEYTVNYIKDESQKKDTQYTVHYTINGTEVEKDKLTVKGEAWVNDDPAKIAIADGGIPAPAKKYQGYKLDPKNPEYPEAGQEVNSGAEYTVNYIKDENWTRSTKYTVRHVVDGVEQTEDTKTYTATAWINDQNPMIEIQNGSVDAKSYTGYKFASISPEVTAGDKVVPGNIITLTYVKDDEQIKTLEYTVKYVVGGIERTELTHKYTKPVWVNEDNTLEIQAGSIDKMKFDGYKFDSITDNVKVGDKVTSGKTITLSYVADFEKLDAAGFERPYDGTASSVSITGTIAGDKIEFLTDARTVDNRFTAVNVGDSAEKLTVKVTRGNESWTKDVKAVITPLDVTLKSADLIKMYDGSALTNGDAALETEDGFIPGEGAEYTFTGSRTEVGSSENTFTYELKEGTLAENYNIIAEPGTLTITPASDNPIVTPGGNDAPPVTPATVIRVMTGAPPAVANFIGGAIQSAGARVSELVVSEDDEVPLANMKGEHRCCIFHFLLMLIALILLALYTRNMKKRQEELFELRRQIDEERAAQGLPPAGEDQWVRK